LRKIGTTSTGCTTPRFQETPPSYGPQAGRCFDRGAAIGSLKYLRTLSHPIRSCRMPHKWYSELRPEMVHISIASQDYYILRLQPLLFGPWFCHPIKGFPERSHVGHHLASPLLQSCSGSIHVNRVISLQGACRQRRALARIRATRGSYDAVVVGAGALG